MEDGRIYVRVDEDEGRCLIALDEDGRELEGFQVKQERFLESVVIGSDGTLYTGNYDSRIYAYTPDGRLKWRAGPGSYIRSRPLVGKDGTIYFGADDQHFYPLNPDGGMKWEQETQGGVNLVYSHPSTGPDGTIYYGVFRLVALNPDGEKKWEVPIGKGGHRVTVGPDGLIYSGCTDGHL